MSSFVNLSNIWLVCLFILAFTAAAEKPAVLVCGADVVTVGDAWTKISLMRNEADTLLMQGKMDTFTAKTTAILVHLRFMETNAIMLIGRRQRILQRSLLSAESLTDEIMRLAQEGEARSLDERWTEMKAVLQLAAAQFPDEALMSTERFAHLLPPVKPILHIQMEPLTELQPGKPVRLKFQIVYIQDLRPVAGEDLLLTHGALLHAMICDESLTDYHHEHPEPTGKSGEWELTFVPRLNQPYRLWINAVPKETGREEFAMNQISLLSNPSAAAKKETVLAANAAELRAKMAWITESPPKAKAINRANLKILDAAGDAVTDLEDYMEAQAHIVGIHEDFRTLLHVHPENERDEVGGEIRFSFNPPQAGFYRLFVQIKRQGVFLTFPFGIQVK
ncbi:hypothetical protein [Prosthecobacter dejongeii]|uniref:Uncharacterized protein n=1 Tax=Prosthecobacter dejongeii TaxID=48465 RepID=A0A7W7YQ14_9BACT|nr:hypothetical protein [Prosthecobacter dejongeii]MBB5040077.1 hypothetical protein [Prosthecobacter dejongeii]